MSPPRIYLSVDMEGGTGIVHREQLGPEGKDYERGRKLITGDVVAAIEGALAGGATEVLVNDAHGTMRNLLIESLPAAATLISGPASTQNKPLCQTQGADGGFDLAFLVGYHARAGAEPGLLAHTWVGALIHEVRVNGSVFGESAINACVLGHFGVPVGLVTGADELAREVACDLPAGVRVAVVKRALGPSAAACLAPEAARAIIREAAEAAVRDAASIEPLRIEGPVTVELAVHTRQQAHHAAEAQGVERAGERVVRIVAQSPPEAMAAAWRGVEMALRQPSPWLS